MAKAQIRTRASIGGLTALVLAVIACGQPGPSEPPPTSRPTTPPLGGVWHATRVGELPVVAGSRVGLAFVDDRQRVEGTTGCADIGGRVAIDGDRILVADISIRNPVTCPGAVADVATAFIETLANAVRIGGGDGRLVLVAPGTTILLVGSGPLAPTAGEADELSRLTTQTWRITEVAGHPIAAPFGPLNLGQDGTLLSRDPCGYGGMWRFRGERFLAITAVSWDGDEGCGPGSDRTRADIATALEAVEQFRVSGDGRELRLIGRFGEVLLVTDRG